MKRLQKIGTRGEGRVKFRDSLNPRPSSLMAEYPGEAGSTLLGRLWQSRYPRNPVGAPHP